MRSATRFTSSRWFRVLFVTVLPGLSACPSPPHVVRASQCAWSTGKISESLDLDTATFVQMTRDVAARKAAIDPKWSLSARRFTGALGLADYEVDKILLPLRDHAQVLRAAKCKFQLERRLVCVGEPDDAMRRETRLELHWSPQCPALPPDAQKALSNLDWLSKEPLHDLVESAIRYRALLSAVEAVAARKRLIPKPATDEERREWDCAASELKSMIDELKSKLALADDVERAFKDTE